jgi:hypothetical protein
MKGIAMPVFMKRSLSYAFCKAVTEHQAVLEGAITLLEHGQFENGKDVADAIRRTAADLAAFGGRTKEDNERVAVLLV